MLFDDYFYPGNPQRRQQVSDLRGQVRADFMMFKNSWNDCAAVLNPILAVNHPDLQLMILTCDTDVNCVKDCVDMFNAAITDAQPKFAKLLNDIGLSAGVPGLKPGDITMDPDALHKINSFLTGAADTAVSAFATWYVYNSIRLFTLVLNYAGVAVSEVASMLAGALGGLVVGAVGFVITDIIGSAIAGAVERKELNEAIDALTEFRDKVADPLLQAAGKLAGVTQSIKDGAYKLSDTLLIIKTGSGYQVITIPAAGMDGLYKTSVFYGGRWWDENHPIEIRGSTVTVAGVAVTDPRFGQGTLAFSNQSNTDRGGKPEAGQLTFANGSCTGWCQFAGEGRIDWRGALVPA
jgi:hypothetical protein